VLNEAMYGSLPNLGELRPDVPRQLETVLWQALAHYPRRRFQTAQEMRDALTYFQWVSCCGSCSRSNGYAKPTLLRAC
jgi:hypothetical protein